MVQLRAASVTKVYRINPRLRELLCSPSDVQAKVDEGCVLALDRVSLTAQRGESIAILGMNGAGKSSLLRILSGRSRPTSGVVESRARVGVLLDLGAGLVDEWTGEVNARSWLALEGRSPDRLSDVECSAELGGFFTRPVRTYSAGMRLRLAYALAVVSRPDVLIADEVVGVGDEAFQRRCALQMQAFLAGGGSLILATHSLYLAEKLCQQALWLERGKVRLAGPIHDVTVAYREALAASCGQAVEPTTQPLGPRPEDGAPVLVVEGHDMAVAGHSIDTGAPWRVRVASPLPWADRQWLVIRRADGTLVTTLSPDGGLVAFRSCELLPGRFVIELHEASSSTARQILRAREALNVRGARRELGAVLLEHEWS